MSTALPILFVTTQNGNALLELVVMTMTVSATALVGMGIAWLMDTTPILMEAPMVLAQVMLTVQMDIYAISIV